MPERSMRTPPRILFVTAALNAVGGIPSYARCMIEALEALGDVRVLDLSLSGSRRDQMTGMARVTAELARFRPDLLVLGHLGFGPMGLAWKALGGRFAVVTYGIEVWTTPSRQRTLTLTKADAVWTISSFTAGEVRRIAPAARIAPVLGGNIDERFFQPHESVDGPFRALVVSRLHDLRHKGIDTVVDAVQLVATDASVARAIELRIVGAGEARSELDRLIDERDKAEVVRVLGPLDDDELRAEYRRADVVLLVSRHERGAHARGEGLGLVVLEGAAAGTTAIASEVGGSTDIVVDGETGFLIPAGEPDVLAEKLRLLAGDADRCRAMGERARDFVRSEHTMDAFARRVKAAFDETVHAPS
jgi:glycosyltransferase involved in cell wall biosynthesis